MTSKYAGLSRVRHAPHSRRVVLVAGRPRSSGRCDPDPAAISRCAIPTRSTCAKYRPAPRRGRARGSVASLGDVRLACGNPAPYARVIDLPDHGQRLATGSPELFLSRDRDLVQSRPIKGIGRVAANLALKDHTENVMVTDLVRNDLGHVAAPGSAWFRYVRDRAIPGACPLVSNARARLAPGVAWPDLLASAFPPGSVNGALADRLTEAGFDLVEAGFEAAVDTGPPLHLGRQPGPPSRRRPRRSGGAGAPHR